MTDDRIRDGHFECDVGRWALNRALAQAVKERDEARAEVERLRKECNDARAALSSLSEAARRCVFEGLTKHFDPPCLIPSPGLLDALVALDIALAETPQPAEAEPSSNGHRREAVSSSHVPARKALPEEVAAPSTPPRGEARPGERADSDAGSDARVERLKPRKGDDALRLWVEEFDGMVWAQGRSEGIEISTEQRALAELCRRALGGDA